MSGEESLESLQLFSLELVRLREDMTEVYKIMKMVDKVNADLSFVKFCNMITRCYTGKLVKKELKQTRKIISLHGTE